MLLFSLKFTFLAFKNFRW